MKIIIDYITKLDQQTAEYRDNFVKGLAEARGTKAFKNIDLIAAGRKGSKNKARNVKFIYFSRRYKWKKDLKIIEKMKPDGIVLFSKPGRKLCSNYHCYLYLEAIIKNYNDLVHPSRIIKKLLQDLDMFKGVLVRTEYMRIYLQNHYFADKDKIIVLGEGSEKRYKDENITKDIRTIRRVLSIYRASMPYIFLSGSLGENSFIDKALEAFAQVYPKYPDLKLLFASPEFKMGWDNKAQPLNKNAAKILELCEDLKITRKVIFTGQIEEKHLPIIISNAVISVYLSSNLTFSKFLLRILAAGSPLIISDDPVLKEIVKGAGVAVAPKIIDPISEALLAILINDKERSRLKVRALSRVEYYTWEKAAIRALQRISYDMDHRTKQKILLTGLKYSDPERIKTLKKLFVEFFILNEDYIKIPSFRRIISFLRFLKALKQNDCVYITGFGGFRNGLKLLIAKIFCRQTKFIGEIPEEYFNLYNSQKFSSRILFEIKNFILGIFLKIIFNRYIIDNILLLHNLKKAFHIRSKVDFLPVIFPDRYASIDASVLRDKYRLKNYVCITVRLQEEKDVQGIYKMAEFLYKYSKEFKFLLIDLKDKNIEDKNPKVMKKLLFLNKSKLKDALLNSRIYLDMRGRIDQKDILTAMKTKNLCITNKTLSSRYLIKQGIQGYLFSSLETDKIARQIKALLDNRSHLEDVRRVNKLTAISFNHKHTKERFNKIIRKW